MSRKPVSLWRLRGLGPALVVASLGLVLSGCGAHRGAAPTVVPPREPAVVETVEPEPGPPGVYHRVERGQTLWRIARAYDVPLERLAAINGIHDPASIEEGTLLFVPGARQTIEVPPPGPTPLQDTDHVRLGPLVWPVTNGNVLSRFGAARPGRRHKGLDISGRPGQPILAVASGRVVYSGSTMRGYGKTVILDHGNGLRSLYAHGSKLLVRVGQRVERGQTIALVGRTGNASTEHCHFELRRQGISVDPLPYLNASGGP